LPKFNDAKCFAKCDGKEAFWHISLDQQPRKLTAMITPFGLPFGLKVSCEIFYEQISQSLVHLPGVICIADDIIIIGQRDNIEKAKIDLENKIKMLRQVCSEKNIILNEKKTVNGKDKIKFMGHVNVISANGVEVDPDKVKAISEMPTPNDPASIRRFCGMLQ
jgi:hypothetical protein